MNSILVVNSGSSSLKFALFDTDGENGPAHLRGSLSGIGAQGRVRIVDRSGAELEQAEVELPDAAAALSWMLDWLDRRGEKQTVVAVGHRLVHGGPRQFEPLPLDQAALETLRQAVPFAPLHLPPELAAIEALGWGVNGKPQYAVFDTQFHESMPQQARVYPLPRNFADSGVVRYGFHGLSYQSCLTWLRRKYGEDAAQGRLVVAHLGSGCSLAAIRDGRSLDCTMGFSPTGGVTMGTRSGDLDPGLLLYLLEQEGMTPRQLSELLQRRSGLLGLSGGRSADPGELLRHESEDASAKLALAVFCYSVRKALGAFAAVLGGVDRLVFTGGVGEHLPQIRARICTGLEFLGLELDPQANQTNAAVISAGTSQPIHVVPADEEGVIAAAVAACLKRETSHA
jgi:acetate kinase